MPRTLFNVGIAVSLKWFCCAVAVLLFSYCATCQQYDTISKFGQPIQLDSYVVKSNFDVDAFIRRVRTDTTFYKAFKSMRLIPYTAKNDIRVYNSDGEVEATYMSRTQQVRDSGCRRTEVLEEHTTGDFYTRSGSYRYYTAKLFAHIFFAKEPVCGENDVVKGALDAPEEGEMAKREYQLKQLIFNPGAKVGGVPFMGDRASIFEPSEAAKYDFKISVEKLDGMPLYVFRITPKKGFERNTLYNELTTWFRKSDYSIVARDYSLSYNTFAYDFDVRMTVRTVQSNGRLYPTHITYDGNWHVITKKRERAKFEVDVAYAWQQ